ncbi:hypothetical protein [Flavobacterium chilense]|uniref:Chaperone of endosialidase n=1 Tax=Flavobacterium chilense TaxID=946677 RepID=A0A1M7MX21_9FLAO|nr:hypothetical protein [Flavobacterium chilense]SHM95607.1 hypothetical protein SAMN05444484_11528 [Flavobacterium chilense]
MKKITFLLILLIAQTHSAQSIFPTDGGNVGIGTTSPTNSLTIRKTPDQNFAHIYFGEPMAVSGQPSASLCFGGAGIQNSGFTWVPSNTDEGKLHLSFGGQDNGIKNPIKMTFQSNGNVGIGTTNPLNGLHVFKLNDFNGGSIRFGHSGAYDALLSFGWNNSTSGDAFKLSYSPHNSISNVIDLLTIGISGNVGIGTTNPDAKLAVNGTIHSKEVKVDLNVPAPDYVFKNEYNLRSLQEVENFINKNSHLPEIPSAKEFEKNGIQLAEMNMALLKKIEELTLYVIEQNKRIDAIEKENKILKKK